MQNLSIRTMIFRANDEKGRLQGLTKYTEETIRLNIFSLERFNGTFRILVT